MEQDILTLAALVAAFVGVAKGYGVPAKHSSAIALAVAALFVLVPDNVQQTVVTIATIGLTASGAYSYVKTRDGGGK
ncbi:hypothetical protein COLU111180_12035 [Cohnella lubricantis]|uniref:Holin n=1 Tax=Cohnella lubricantis TaxID=2163172 RepID=A0A841T781_9BACL|nr:hypothetical protein [Cohnella lubricantis]MBB6675969.1 hypothetical protein [Cohnella lubricantis]MBP2117912.1 hypothetical protein [Cohnella lubricantis]